MSGTTPSPAIDPADHLGWATGIARQVSNRWRFRPGSQEERDLIQQAHLAVVRAVERFDPSRCPPGGCLDGLFRGWCRQDIRQECQREARRLLNAGVYKTRREHENPRLIKGFSFSDLTARAGGIEYDVADDYRPDVIVTADPLFDLADDLEPAGSRCCTYRPTPRAVPCI